MAWQHILRVLCSSCGSAESFRYLSIIRLKTNLVADWPQKIALLSSKRLSLEINAGR
jgi:hypothetical protein